MTDVNRPAGGRTRFRDSLAGGAEATGALLLALIVGLPLGCGSSDPILMDYPMDYPQAGSMEPAFDESDDPESPSDILYRCSQTGPRVDLSSGHLLRLVVSGTVRCTGLLGSRALLHLSGQPYRTARLDDGLALLEEGSGALALVGQGLTEPPFLHAVEGAERLLPFLPDLLDDVAGPWLLARPKRRKISGVCDG